MKSHKREGDLDQKKSNKHKGGEESEKGKSKLYMELMEPE